MGKLRERTNKRSNRKRSNKRKNTKRTKKRENTKRTNKRSNRKRSKNTKRTRKIHKKGGCFSCSGRPKEGLRRQTSVRLQRPVYPGPDADADADPDPDENKPLDFQYMVDQMTIPGDHSGHSRAERNPIQQHQPQPQPQTQTQGPNHPGCEECLGRKNWLGHYTHNYCRRGEEKGTCYRINSDKFGSKYACDGGNPTSCSSNSSVSGCRGQDTYGHTCRNENWGV